MNTLDSDQEDRDLNARRKAFEGHIAPLMQFWLEEVIRSPLVCALIPTFERGESYLIVGYDGDVPSEKRHRLEICSLGKAMTSLRKISASSYYRGYTGERSQIATIVSCNRWYQLYYSTAPAARLTSIYPNLQYNTGITLDHPLIQLSIVAFSIVWGRGSHLPLGEYVVCKDNNMTCLRYTRGQPWMSDVWTQVSPEKVFRLCEDLEVPSLFRDPHNVFQSLRDVLERKC